MSETAPEVGPLAKLVIVVGAAVMVFGFFGLLFIDEARTHPLEFFKWFGGGLIVHDALLAPVVAIVTTLGTRLLPVGIRRQIQGALFASAVIALTTFPFWRGYGRREDNASVLPNDYAAGLLWAFAVIWMTAGGWVLISTWRNRRPSAGVKAEVASPDTRPTQGADPLSS